MRKQFDKEMHAHYKQTTAKRSGSVYVFGDMNTAATEGDCSPAINHYPSTKEYEREAHKLMKHDFDLIDVYEELHSDLKDNRTNGDANSDHFTWHTGPHSDHQGGMRLDMLLAPRNTLANARRSKGIIKCELADSKYGSDHTPLIVTMRNKAQPAATESLNQCNEAMDTNKDKKLYHTDKTEDTYNVYDNNDGEADCSPPRLRRTVVIEECIEPDENQDSEENFKPIFKQLRKIPGPENGIYDSGNPQLIADLHGKEEVIQFNKNDERLTAMKDSLRKSSTHHLNSLEDDDNGLPIITAFAEKESEPVQVLLDSGAKGIFMPATLVRKLGLHVKPAQLSVTIGDNSVVQSTGIALLPLTIGSAKYEEEVVVLSDYPYDIIAGTTFFKKYKGDLSFRDNRLTLDNPRTEEPVHVYLNTTSVQLIAEHNMTIAPQTEAQIPILPGLADAKWLTLEEEERWETVADTKKKTFKVANGIMRVRENDNDIYNWIRAKNAGDSAIEIKERDTVAHFKPLDTVHEILHLDEKAELKMDAASDAVPATTEEEVDAAIIAKPYLDDLDLSDKNNTLTPQQQLINKEACAQASHTMGHGT
jgi:exonuclease III